MALLDILTWLAGPALISAGSVKLLYDRRKRIARETERAVIRAAEAQKKLYLELDHPVDWFAFDQAIEKRLARNHWAEVLDQQAMIYAAQGLTNDGITPVGHAPKATHADPLAEVLDPETLEAYRQGDTATEITPTKVLEHKLKNGQLIVHDAEGRQVYIEAALVTHVTPGQVYMIDGNVWVQDHNGNWNLHPGINSGSMPKLPSSCIACGERGNVVANKDFFSDRTNFRCMTCNHGWTDRHPAVGKCKQCGQLDRVVRGDGMCDSCDIANEWRREQHGKALKEQERQEALKRKLDRGRTETRQARLDRIKDAIETGRMRP